MRVIAGRFRSRTLKSLPGVETRPTYDRLKETLFNVLASSGRLEGTTFLDLFAGTGSIGIEALSRGAARAIFVESNRKAASIIRQNVHALELTTQTEILERDAVQAIPTLAAAGITCDIIFLDPPYKLQNAYEQTFRALACSPIVTPETVIVAEHDKRFDPGNTAPPLMRYRILNQGESSLSFYKRVY